MISLPENADPFDGTEELGAMNRISHATYRKAGRVPSAASHETNR
jgi:hypothetical protein